MNNEFLRITFIWIVLIPASPFVVVGQTFNFERGDTLDQTRKSVDLKTLREPFAGESRVRTMVFNSYVVGAGVEAVFVDATVKKKSP